MRTFQTDYIEISRKMPECDFRNIPRIDSLEESMHPSIRDYYNKEAEQHKGKI